MADRDFLGVLDVIKPGKPEPFGAADQMAQCTASGRERNRIPHCKPQQTDNRADGRHAGHDIEHALAPHHAAIKQCNARQGHQQHQGGRGHHPGSVRPIDGFGADPARLRERDGRGCSDSRHCRRRRDRQHNAGINRWRAGHRCTQCRRGGPGRRLRMGLLGKQAHPHPDAETQRNQSLAVHTGLLFLLPDHIRNKKHNPCQFVYLSPNQKDRPAKAQKIHAQSLLQAHACRA